MRKVERFRALQYLEEIVKKSGDVAKLRLRGKGSGFAGALVPAFRHSMGGHRQSLHHGHGIMLATLLPLFPHLSLRVFPFAFLSVSLRLHACFGLGCKASEAERDTNEESPARGPKEFSKKLTATGPFPSPVQLLPLCAGIPASQSSLASAGLDEDSRL